MVRRAEGSGVPEGLAQSVRRPPALVHRATAGRDRERAPGSRMMDTYAVSEQERVEMWRLRVLLRAEFPLVLAERIAASEADVHRALDLVEDGCPFELAAEIVL